MDGGLAMGEWWRMKDGKKKTGKAVHRMALPVNINRLRKDHRG